MYAFHRRINKREKLVGWYTTTSPEGALINHNSSLINDFFLADCASPIHIVVDTSLVSDKVDVRGFISQPMSISGVTLASKFNEVKVELEMSEGEATCLYHMINGQPAGEEFVHSDIYAAIPSDREMLHGSMEKLLGALDSLQKYVDNVVAGKQLAHAAVGMQISDAVGVLQTTKPEEVQAVLQEKMQDLLMVSHLSTLAQTQTQIAEKIHSIL
jgi:translation initiation factor 3 subunit F